MLWESSCGCLVGKQSNHLIFPDMRKFLFSLIALFAFSSAVAGQQPFTVRLYPDGPTDSNGLSGDAVTNQYGYITNISDPTLTVYLPDKKKATGQTVVVCPGGGYGFVSSFNEGRDVAAWMTRHGIAVVELHYRLPNGHHSIPLSDALAAIEYAKKNAAEWGLDADKVGIIGFSAGGHLAASASTLFTEQSRPAFSILIYPVITFDERYTHRGTRENLIGKGYNADLVERYSTERQVSSATPPTFIAVCTDDRVVDARNSTMYYDALVAHKVPAEMHVYPKGGHGWGFDQSRLSDYRDEFNAALARWLGERLK